MIYTFEDFQNEVAIAREQHTSWRYGQTAFNVLYQTRPDLSEQIRATKFDPFHRDERIPDFYAWVKEHWND